MPRHATFAMPADIRVGEGFENYEKRKAAERAADPEWLRKDFAEKHHAAEKAAHALFAALPVGPERTRMAEVYENVRTANRVPL